MAGKVEIKATGKNEDLIRKQDQVIKKQGQMISALKRTSAQSKQTAQDAKQMTGNFIGAEDSVGRLAGGLRSVTSLLGIGGVTGAVGAVVSAHSKWLEIMARISESTRKAGNDIIAFAAIQEGGTAREAVLSTERLAATFGIDPGKNRGEIFNAAQALQSVRGKAAGRKALETVFAGSTVGIPIELGTELEVLGAGQGAKVGDFLRKAFVAGQLSSRDPKTLAAAAPGLKFFEDKNFGFAAAAVLAGTVKAGELPTFLKQGGRALSSTSSVVELLTQVQAGEAEGNQDIAKLLSAGFLKATTQKGRLGALSEAGIDTAEELTRVGFADQTQIEALTGLVPNFGAVMKTQQGIRSKAVPGVLLEKRRGIELEFPELRISREISQVESLLSTEEAFGHRAIEALETEKSRKIRGLARRRTGKDTFGPFDLVDEQGREKPLGEFLKFFENQPESGAFGTGEESRKTVLEERRIERELRGLDEGLFDNAATTVGSPAPISGRPGGSGEQQRVIEALDKVAEKLDENSVSNENNAVSTDRNTSATRENTGGGDVSFFGLGPGALDSQGEG